MDKGWDGSSRLGLFSHGLSDWQRTLLELGHTSSLCFKSYFYTFNTG